MVQFGCYPARIIIEEPQKCCLSSRGATQIARGLRFETVQIHEDSPEFSGCEESMLLESLKVSQLYGCNRSVVNIKAFDD
ncbi:hypothetical protein T265_08717 [Opisthorchis viverrini]|uniref:Uncharacterized protein n=1 Tax=Opisthorchis viverrini TaxID=6198 RepID=A0A074Z8E6_OPIVI|nr:hypothetical protein T265_08717 [Opisthorchis viverrini]KER23393.1 hypothetical protein T265_08717 [Opisthorchis viverrini]